MLYTLINILVVKKNYRLLGLKEAKVIDSFKGFQGIIQKRLFFPLFQQKQIYFKNSSGLEAIHAKGLVHEDIKLANILYQINDVGVVTKSVLCDFVEISLNKKTLCKEII